MVCFSILSGELYISSCQHSIKKQNHQPNNNKKQQKDNTHKKPTIQIIISPEEVKAFTMLLLT